MLSLGDAGGGLENHRDALPSPSSLGAASQSRLLLLTSMDLAQPMPQVWGTQQGTLLSQWDKVMGGCVLVD